MTADGGLVIWAEPVRGRSCGGCTACCTQVPVQELRKAANERCRHLSATKRCTVYARRPRSCATWSCRWLFDPDTAALRRPDKSGYVIDSGLDTVIINNHPVDAIQVWVDPARRDAHRDPALRAYLAFLAERLRMPAIVRWSSDEGFGLIAPCLNPAGEWMEIYTTKLDTQADLNARLATLGYERTRFDVVTVLRDEETGETMRVSGGKPATSSEFGAISEST